MGVSDDRLTVVALTVPLATAPAVPGLPDVLSSQSYPLAGAGLGAVQFSVAALDVMAEAASPEGAKQLAGVQVNVNPDEGTVVFVALLKYIVLVLEEPAVELIQLPPAAKIERLLKSVAAAPRSPTCG